MSEIQLGDMPAMTEFLFDTTSVEISDTFRTMSEEVAEAIEFEDVAALEKRLDSLIQFCIDKFSLDVEDFI